MGQSAENVREQVRQADCITAHPHLPSAQVSQEAEDQERQRDGGDRPADQDQPGQRGPVPRHPGQAEGGDEEPAGVQAEHCAYREVRPPGWSRADRAQH